MSSSRPFDLVLFGATGFTGRLVAEALARTAPLEVRLALAGRSPERLVEVQKSLGAAGARFGVLVADAADAGSIRQVAEQSRVVCTTVGPYAKYGLPMVKACAAAGTHYCDLTGEVGFMRDSIDACHQAAQASGARLVHTCGFDSIPSDLGALMMHQAFKARGESGQMASLDFVLTSLSGGFSGGTIASMLVMLDEVKAHPERRRLMADPYALSPDRSREADLGRQRDLTTLRYDQQLQQWTAPFVMAAVNTRVVRRSNALLGYAYGPAFRYRELMGVKKGPKGLLTGAAITFGLGAVVGALVASPTRALAMRFLPKPGEGPDEQTRRNGRFKARLVATSVEGTRLTGTLAGQGDPGYSLTSTMLSQAALCLALDEAKLPKRSGVLTPASAMGECLTERLKAQGMTFSAE